MRQTVTRRVTGVTSLTPAWERSTHRDSLVGGWPVFAPPASPRNRALVVRGPWQAGEKARGMGSDSPYEGIAKLGVTSAGTIMAGMATAVGTSAAATGTAGATFLGMAPSLAVPVIGAVVVGVVIALTLLFNRKGPKQKVATTKIVNDVEPLLQENLKGYMEGPRNTISQAQAIENYKAGWQYVVDNCDVPVMGNPGKLCVSDRSPGGRWPWKEYYLDPIVNDPHVKELAAEEAAALAARVEAGVTGDVTALMGEKVAGIPVPLLIAGALAAVVVMSGGSKP